MNLMISMRGEAEQLPYLAQIAELGAGIELGSYGLVGIRSERDWEARIALHERLRARFVGPIAVHGPFIGMEYGHIDHLIAEVVRRRMDMTFDVATRLRASRVVLHGGYTRDVDVFSLQDSWLQRCAEFWKREIARWADAGIEIVIENDSEQLPDLLVKLADEVDSPSLGLCLDIGHQHLVSELGALEWVRRMARRLRHFHLHDNDSVADRHWSIGRGTIEFEPFYAAILQQVPEATVTLEVDDTMEAQMRNLRMLASRLTPGRPTSPGR